MSSNPEQQADVPAPPTDDAGPAAPTSSTTPAPAGGDDVDDDDTGLLPPDHWTDLAQRQEDDGLDDGDSAFGDVASSTDSITSSILEYRTIHGRTYHSDAIPGDAQYWGSNDRDQNESMDIK